MADESSSRSRKAEEEAPERYLPSEWGERARQIGHSPHAIAGALHDAKPDKGLTEDEVRSKVERFLKAEVKP